MRLNDKNLLVISSYYPDKENKMILGVFVKNQLEYIRKIFKRVDVIALVAYIPKILTTFGPIKHRKNQLGLKDYNYNNVHVHFIYYPTFPTKFFRKYGKKAALFLTKRYIKKNNIKFDIIHAHFTHPSGYVATKIKEEHQKPVILTVHEGDILLNDEIHNKDPLLEFSWMNSDVIIRVNKKDIPKLIKFNKNIISIPNGFDDKTFRPLNKKTCRKRLGISFDKKVIFSVGILTEQKGMTYSIEAMESVIKKAKNVIYFIGGSGPSKESLQHQINESRLQNYVKLIGFVPEELMPIWMNSCDIFLLPSLQEGNPTVMFEALGCGKPYVGTNVGGVSEIIVNNNLGLLVKPKNITCGKYFASYK